MSEDRSWMYKRVVNGYISDEYLQGVKRFMSHALSSLEGQAEKRIRCPCTKCNNGQLHDRRVVQMHLCNKGFTENYHVWNRHGESEARDDETHDVGTNSERDGSGNTYEDFDHMDEMVLDAAGPNFDHNMPEQPNADASSFYHMLDAADKPLWENCEKHTQLSAVTRLLTVKSEHNVSVSCFDDFIKAINEMLPQDANLPGSFYKCKKVVEALGMPVQKIDVCKNDCMLYYKEHSNRRKCITCNEPRYAEGDALPENKKGTPQKVLRYLPIIPRLQRLYMSESTAKHMTYHKEGLESEKRNNEKRKKKLAHPADTEAWKEVDKKYPDFAKDPRNVRLGLSTDGFTPFNHTASSYSCWPVFIVPYNLPPALCMKQQNIFLNMVIPGPKHPGKNIDVFFRPLIDELLQLWTNGIWTYDRFRNQNFLMKAALIGTVSDFPAYGMLSGWSTHGKLACPIWMEDIKSFMDPMKKNVSSTITCLLKAYYPGVYRPLDEHGRQVPEKDAVVIAHYHSYPVVTRKTILAEFLKRFKFAAGREDECALLFDRKAVERFSQALSHEKFQAKRSLVKSMKEKHAANKSQQICDGILDEHTDASRSEGVVLSHPDDNVADDFDGDDPQLWKEFPPSWIEKKWWGKLCDLWSDENVKKVSAQNSKNRKEGGGVHHTCGSRSVAVHKQAMKIENGGEDVDDLEVFARTHRHEKGKGKYANKKAEKLVDEFNNCFKESGNTQVDKQQVWVQLTRGRKRGRYYGLPGIIDKDHAHRSSTPVLTNGTQPMYTQQQVQDIVSQAVTSAVREVREELGTRIQSLERIVDKPNTESHSHVLEEPQSSAVPEFLQALTMDGFNTHEDQRPQSERSQGNDDPWDF